MLDHATQAVLNQCEAARLEPTESRTIEALENERRRLEVLYDSVLQMLARERRCDWADCEVEICGEDFAHDQPRHEVTLRLRGDIGALSDLAAKLGRKI